MRKIVPVALFVALSYSGTCSGQAQEPPEPYKPTLDRLESLTTVPLPEWHYHADIPHPEDPELNDVDWQTVKTREAWKTGSRVLRRWIAIPEKINGYATQGSRVNLELFFDTDDRLGIVVFSNGALVVRGDDDTQQPIPLTANAQPGQKFLIAVRLNTSEVNTRIAESRLSIEPPATRPDAGILRAEILSARPMIAAFPDGQSEREGQLDAAVKAI